MGTSDWYTSDWYELRSLAPRDRPLTVLVAATFVIGLVLIGGIGGIASSEDLPKDHWLGAVGVVALGVALGVALLVAGTRLQRALAARRFNKGEPFLRVDGDGVWILTGPEDADTAASVPWNAVTSVEATTRTFGAEFTKSPGGVLDVLRFVLSDESAVQHDPFPPEVAAEASALGLSPASAAFCVTTWPSHDDLTSPLLQWLSVKRPDLPIRDERRHEGRH